MLTCSFIYFVYLISCIFLNLIKLHLFLIILLPFFSSLTPFQTLFESRYFFLVHLLLCSLFQSTFLTFFYLDSLTFRVNVSSSTFVSWRMCDFLSVTQFERHYGNCVRTPFCGDLYIIPTAWSLRLQVAHAPSNFALRVHTFNRFLPLAFQLKMLLLRFNFHSYY